MDTEQLRQIIELISSMGTEAAKAFFVYLFFLFTKSLLFWAGVITCLILVAKFTTKTVIQSEEYAYKNSNNTQILKEISVILFGTDVYHGERYKILSKIKDIKEGN